MWGLQSLHPQQPARQVQQAHPLEPLLPWAAPCRHSQPCLLVSHLCVLLDLGTHHSLPDCVSSAVSGEENGGREEVTGGDRR